MASLQTQTARLRFCCTYQQAAPVGVYEQNHLKLAQDCIDYLRSLNELQSGVYYEWECYPHAVQAQSELVEVSVYFVPKQNRYSSSISVLHARQLWNALLERYGCEASWTLFDGRMYWINMLPVDVDSAEAQAALLFAQLIEDVHSTIEPQIDVKDVAKLSTGDCMVLATDTLLRTVEACLTIIAFSPSAVLKDVAFESILTGANDLLSRLSQTVVLPMHLSICNTNPQDVSIADLPMSPYAMAEFIGESKDPTSSATGSQSERKAKLQKIALNMAKIIANVRTQMQTPPYGGTTEQVLVKVVESTDALRIVFQDSHRAAMARVRHCLVMDVPSAALYDEAMRSVKQLQTLSRYLTDGSKSLTAILENRRKSRNITLGTVMGTAAVTAAAATMLPGLIVVGAAYAGVGVTAATAPYLTLKWFEESPQGEKLKQAQQHIDKVHQTLFEQIVACFVTRAWGMNLRTLSPADRERTLKGFGLEQSCFDAFEYTEAKLRDALEEVENAHDSLMYDLEGVFMDIGMTVSKVETATTRPTRQLSPATMAGQISSGRAC